ncbi:MAG: D-Ala-D-Ala carboxypeptidase family metallohydrolase [Luteolibacter sp.]|uniref:D-Ala-D-Ala carboxypeptidase family metallohydrolase n=1 Tax=Luteolibacter sp. TaxID=1962973 RepID=UPI0032672235
MLFPTEPTLTTPLESALLDRRRVLGGLGLTGLGMLAGSDFASAAPLQKSGGVPPVVSVQTQARAQAPLELLPPRRIDLSGVPEEWARNQGSLLPEYNRYLTNLKLKFISPQQVIEAHAKNHGSIWNTLPPKTWWTRMGYTLRVADRIALEMNVNQVEVVSAYRCPPYNAHCDGAKSGSWHQANVAVDVKFPVRASQVTATARNLRDRGLFKGGVGGYWNFTHIDTRGENMNW